MNELVQQILHIILFDGAKQPVAVMPEGAVDPPESLLPDNCRLERASGSATAYLTSLWNLLDAHRPARLLLVPPFIPVEELPQKIKTQYPDLDLPDIALGLALDKLPAGSRFGVLVPRGFLLNTRSRVLREQVNQAATPRFIVELDFEAGQLLNDIPAGVSLHLLVIETGRPEDRLVRFFRCPDIPPRVGPAGQNEVDHDRRQGVLKDLKRLVKKGGGATEFGFIVREGIPPNTPWLYDRHHPHYRRQVEDLGHFGQVRPLGDLVKMWFGFRPSDQVNLLLPGRESKKGIPVIEGRDIGRHSLSQEEARYRVLPDLSEPFQLKPDDICLRTVIGPDQTLRAVSIDKEMLPLAVSSSVLVLRPRPDVNLDVPFLVAYLQSTTIVDHLRAQGIADRLYPAALREIPVPVQDEELRAALNDLRTAARSMGRWQAEAEATLQSLFDFRSAQAARAHVLEVGRRIRQRERAAQQVDDLSYRLRTGLPHPLAYRWRMAETAQPTLEGYRDLLECAETTLCYLALMALVMMRAVEEPVAYLETIADRLTRVGHGTNFGDWVAILREVQGSKSLKQMSPVPFYEVARFLDDEPVDQALTLIARNRNDNAHGRGPHGPEIPAKIEETRSALQTLLEATEFLTEYPLRYIEETRRDSIAGITTYRYRTITGDHAIVGLEAEQTGVAELEAHSLYLVDRNGDLYLLRPYLVRQACPQCKNWEIFYLDSYQAKDNTCHLKSMTTGHPLLDDQISDTFRHVGLLQ